MQVPDLTLVDVADLLVLRSDMTLTVEFLGAIWLRQDEEEDEKNA